MSENIDGKIVVIIGASSDRITDTKAFKTRLKAAYDTSRPSAAPAFMNRLHKTMPNRPSNREDVYPLDLHDTQPEIFRRHVVTELDGKGQRRPVPAGERNQMNEAENDDGTQ